jgi:hypothetical protein
MKKILTMLFALLFAFTMQAQNIKLTLNNGQTVSGNTKSLFTTMEVKSVLKIKRMVSIKITNRLR